jgi:outer membrane receptor protein involved in Fe transport
VNVEYAHRDQAWGDQRDWFRNGLVQVDSDQTGTVVNGSNGIPDRLFFKDIRSSLFSNTGTIVFGPGGTFGCGVSPGNGIAYRCPYNFTPSGDLIPITGQRVGIGPDGAFIGGNGENFVDGNQLQITPQLDRYNISAVGHFEITPALVPFFEGTFSRTDSSGTGGSGPAFIAGTALGDVFQFFGGRNREQIRLDNPYLTTQAVNTICGIRAQRGQACPNSLQFSVNEGLLGLGNRTENARRDTYRIVGGIRGDLGSSWNYEVSANFGQLKERTKILGNLDTQRMLLAMDAVRNPANGQIVCRSQIDPSAAFGGTTYFYSYAYGNDGIHHFDQNFQQRLQQDVAACVPVNVLGGQFTDAQKAYLLRNTVSHGKTQQFDATAFITGDTSKFFNLPGGPIGIVLGGEYRTDNLSYDQDPQVQLGYTFYNSIPTFKAPRQKVKEAFGEIRIPIMKDRPLLRELEIDGAARVSNYNLGSTGTVWAYNANLIYSPISGLRLRGNYARAVRAPNQVELFTPFGQNFTPPPPAFFDPCDINQVTQGSTSRAANCLAAGVPAGTQFNYVQSLPYLSGGNQQLQAEVSNSITIGGVFIPRFLPGFSASVDYYDIKVKKAISFLNPQFILDQCYDLPSLDNPFCGFFRRATGAQLGHDAQPFGIIDNSLRVTPFNFAKLKARGLDIEIAYRHQIGRIGRLDTKLTWTHALELTQWTNPADPTVGDRLLSELGGGGQPAAPQDAFNWNSSLQHGRFTFGYQMRYIGRMVVNTYESWFSFEGNPPQDADYSDRTWYPVRFYHDVRLGVDVGPKYNFYLGVDNLTNAKPPYGTSGIGGGSGIYDVYGRFYYAGVVAKF